LTVAHLASLAVVAAGVALLLKGRSAIIQPQ
jgi:hypothetical protein